MTRLLGLSTTRVPGLTDTRISLMPMTALLGPRGGGKSRLLAAISWLLTGSPALGPATAGSAPVVEGDLVDAEGATPRTISRSSGGQPTPPLPRCTLLLARDRLTPVWPVPAGQPEPTSAERIIARLADRTEQGESGRVLLIEEPELDLNPQAQRYFYRVLREYAARNQVIYSTRSSAFVDAVHHHEIVRLDISAQGVNIRRAPRELLTDDQRLRLAAEFDHERAEMFFATAVVLVEGQTERQSLPFIFRRLGHDPDALGISVTEVGGKGNLILAARLLAELNIPHLLVYDSDRGRQGAYENRAIAEAVGRTPQFRLDPDFEAVAGITADDDKVLRAWLRFANAPPKGIPAVFHRIVDTAVRLARGKPLTLEQLEGS